MTRFIKNIDSFSKNIILVFAGTSLVNIFNLLYQILIAHRLKPSDFAAFNALLSIFVLFSMPLATLQMAVAKYSAGFIAQNQIKKVRVLLSSLLKKTFIFAALTFFIFCFISFYIIDKLKIPSVLSGYLLALLLALCWMTPVFSGGLQGLELFKWFMSVSVITGALKLLLAFIFIWLGFNIAGALGALLFASLAGLIISFFPLRHFFSFRIIEDTIDFKEIFLYLFPVIISYFCFMSLVNSDMILVKYFFSPQDAGVYSLAHVLGKIFLFLPGAISIVMFPRVSLLNAQNKETVSTLKKSLSYGLLLSMVAIIVYNIIPVFILKILTGKAPLESIRLGRIFSISMSFYALLFIFISYFLSLKDMRFIKYLVLFSIVQFSAIILFHRTLLQVQLILCANAIILFFILFLMAYKKMSLSSDSVVPNKI